MTPQKEKAKELVELYKDYVHGYVGSSMLTNYEYPEQILKQAKKCALICVDQILEACEYNNVEHWNEDWWNKVKEDIENYEK